MSFNVDQIKVLVKEILHNKLSEKEFVYEYVRQWHVDILTEILHRLKEIAHKNNNQQMKYVVTVLIGEKAKTTNSGLHTALSCLWDGTKDGCVTVKWEDHNIFSIINVCGLAV